MFCVFCQNSFENSENEKNDKDFSFSFIFELLELSADCQSEINSVKDSEIIKFNCVHCSSLLEKGHLILEQIKNLQKELIFVREKLWNELSSSISVSKNDNQIRVILVRESRKAVSLSTGDKNEIIIKTENESQNDENENRDDNLIIPDLTISSENENSSEKLECKLNANKFNDDPDYYNDDNDQIDHENDDDSSNTQFSYNSECDNETDEDYGVKKRKGKPKISKNTLKIKKEPKSTKKKEIKNKNILEKNLRKISEKRRKIPRKNSAIKESKAEESEEEETEIPKRKRGKYRKKSAKLKSKAEPKRKRVKLDPNPNEYFCEICQKTLRSAQNLRFHLKKAVHLNKVKEISGKEIEEEIEKVECPICKLYYAPTSFREHFASNLHIKNEAEAPAELIKILNEKWPNIPRNIKRKKLDPSKWKFKCEICEKIYISTQKLNHHKRTRLHILKEKELTGKDNSKELLINCEICNFSFLSLLSYHQHNKSERHLKNSNETPEENKERICEICNTLFPSKISKKKHFEKVHKITRPYGPRDKKSIIRSELLKEGVKLKPSKNYRKSSQNERRDCLCEHCGQNFLSQNSLDTHIKCVHEKVIKYFCKFCPYKNYYRYVVNDHMKRVHTEKLDYICHICGKGFKSQNCLYSHKYRTHSERRFKCPEPDCEKVFINQYNYKAHVSTHSPELKDSIKCEFCEKSFSHNLVLYRHKVTAHKNEINVKQNAKIIVDNVDELI